MAGQLFYILDRDNSLEVVGTISKSEIQKELGLNGIGFRDFLIRGEIFRGHYDLVEVEFKKDNVYKKKSEGHPMEARPIGLFENGELITSYKSVYEASKSLNIARSTVNNIVSGKKCRFKIDLRYL